MYYCSRKFWIHVQEMHCEIQNSTTFQNHQMGKDQMQKAKNIQNKRAKSKDLSRVDAKVRTKRNISGRIQGSDTKVSKTSQQYIVHVVVIYSKFRCFEELESTKTSPLCIKTCEAVWR